MYEEVVVASVFWSLKDPVHEPGVWWHSCSPGAGLG